MVRLRPECYAAVKAHKLHPRADGPFLVRRRVNPNAYEIAIPPEWGIPNTFNVCDLVPYRGRLDVPTEPGLPPDSTESSLVEPEENDGPRAPATDITADDNITGTDIMVDDDITGTEEDDGISDERTTRPRRTAKPTTQLAGFVYF